MLAKNSEENLPEKVVKHDSAKKQGRILRFKGCFVFFGAILAYNRPKKVKNV